jgi:hypothetical protein
LGFELFNTLPIDSCPSGIAPHLIKGALQVCHPVDLVDQGEPFSSFDSSFEAPQHTIGPD